MYVTCSGLAFYAKIFGRVTKEFIPFARVRCVRKRGGGFVANAIKVEFCDGAPDIIFGSLNKRERALAFITLKLCAANPMALRANQIEDDDGGSWEEDSVDYRSKSVPPSVAARRMRKDAEDEDETAHPGQEALERAQTDGQFVHKASTGKEEMRAGMRSQEKEVMGSSDGLPPAARKVAKKDTFKGMWRVEDDVVDRLSGQAYGAKVEQARRVLQAPVKKVFDMLFAGDWLLDVNRKNGNTDLTKTPWARGDDGFMTRTFEFSRALGYRIGPKATRVVETHRYSFTSAGGAVFETSGHNLDVPLGDSFRVEGYLELSPTSGGSATTIVASVAVHFTKSSMLKSKIESGAIAETKDTYARLLDLADLKVNTEAAEDAVQPSSNMRRDASFNKRSSDNLASMQFRPSVGPDSPTKKYRHHQRSPSSISRALPGELPPLQIPPLQPAHAATGGLPASAATVPHIEAPSGSRLGEIEFGLRVVVVLLLAVIALLLVICAISLSNLRVDVIRLEKLATLAMEKHEISSAASACATS